MILDDDAEHRINQISEESLQNISYNFRISYQESLPLLKKESLLLEQKEQLRKDIFSLMLKLQECKIAATQIMTIHQDLYEIERKFTRVVGQMREIEIGLNFQPRFVEEKCSKEQKYKQYLLNKEEIIRKIYEDTEKFKKVLLLR